MRGPTGHAWILAHFHMPGLTLGGLQGRMLQLPAVRSWIGLQPPPSSQQVPSAQQPTAAAQAFKAAMHLTPQQSLIGTVPSPATPAPAERGPTEDSSVPPQDELSRLSSADLCSLVAPWPPLHGLCVPHVTRCRRVFARHIGHPRMQLLIPWLEHVPVTRRGERLPCMLGTHSSSICSTLLRPPSLAWIGTSARVSLCTLGWKARPSDLNWDSCWFTPSVPL